MNPATTATMFSSASVDWSTPQDFYDGLNREFGFVLDAAASAENAKCELYFSKEVNALDFDWSITDLASGTKSWGAVWLNPPYGRGISKWFAKAYEESLKGATVVMLVPARTDTSYWHRYVIGTNAEVRFIKGRLKFGGHKNSAPFPSAVVVFRPPNQGAKP